MPLGTDYAHQDCSLARSLEVVGERWTLLILRDCFFGVRRFSDFATHLDISKAVLSARLDALVTDGLLERTRAGGHPAYTLTEAGLALWPAIHALAQWGEHVSTPGAPRRLFDHAGCGPLGSDGRCGTCGRAPAPGDIETRPGPGADPTLRHDAVSESLRVPHRLLEPVLVR